ncbi:MAG: membrane protein insertase YidC [Candidatus Tectomicrobia bacterium]|nr:membrane protein insertase YidC [Candidatus Tectomicrobia bacterium]
MEKRAILAIVLSLVVVIIWSIVFAPSTPPPEEFDDLAPLDALSPDAPLPLDDTRLAEQPLPTITAQGEAVALTDPEVQERLIDVDTGVAVITLTSRGAGVQMVQFRDYRTGLEDDAGPIAVRPVRGAATAPLAGDITIDGDRVIPLGRQIFASDSDDVALSESLAVAEVAFTSTLADGLVVRRVYRFAHGRYDFEVETSVEGLSPRAMNALRLQWGPGLLEPNEDDVRRGQTAILPRSYVNDKIVDAAPDENGQPVVEQGTVSWASLGDTYFTAALIPREPPGDAVIVSNGYDGALSIAVRTPMPPDRPRQTMQVYIGPKEEPLLEATEPSLTKVIDLGFFSPMARPMLQLLRLVNRWVHNYGLSIILVTILIKLVFWPLTHKSYKSMKAMQRLQPKMKELQALYKDDKPGLNRAMMQLYRDQKVNPMGGCLPMILQIPFFFAFYNALLYSIELRHAPFICWEQEIFWGFRGICDLSVYDPSYITPVLMGASMFWQQSMTPTVGDPTQAKIMKFMPLIFLFFFLNAPAGLVVYWLINNVLSIMQQMLTNRSRGLEEASAGAVSKR